jgi:hypothetical protein
MAAGRAASVPHASAGSGLTAQPATPVVLSELQPGTSYRYAIITSNGNATELSPPHTFTTQPAATSTTAPSIGSSTAQYINEGSAVIQSEINPQGLNTTYQVQYGTNTGYGASAPLTPSQLAPTTSPQGVLAALAGLAPDTTYHYRLTATNAAGTTNGPDQTLTTTGAPRTTTFTAFTPHHPPHPNNTHHPPNRNNHRQAGRSHPRRLQAPTRPPAMQTPEYPPTRRLRKTSPQTPPAQTQEQQEEKQQPAAEEEGQQALTAHRRTPIILDRKNDSQSARSRRSEKRI